VESHHDLIPLSEHDLFGKPVSTFPDHALTQPNPINRVSNVSETAVIAGQNKVTPSPRPPDEIPTEQSVHQGDYVILGQDASLETNEIRANNALVGHCLFYRRPTKPGIIPITRQSFAEMLFTQVQTLTVPTTIEATPMPIQIMEVGQFQPATNPRNA
jgi:hypothetical protein